MRKPKKLVVDSSVAVKWLNSQGERYLEKADKILQDCQDGKVKLYTPELTKYEIGNAILYKGLTLSQSKACLDTLYSLPVTFVSVSSDDAQDILEIAKDCKITYYDAAFVDLAEEIEASLVTDNPRHQNRIGKIKIILLKDYK